MMTAEIVGGWLWGSMALIADGQHMSTDVRPHAYKARLAAVPGLCDVTIEVHPCPGEHR